MWTTLRNLFLLKYQIASSYVIIAQSYFRCGRRIDITKREYSGNEKKLNYHNTERIKKDCNKSSILRDGISLNNETLIKSTDRNKHRINTFGNSTFYQNIFLEDSDAYRREDQMTKDSIHAKAPLAKIESFSDTMVQTEKFEIGKEVKGSSIHLCCMCRHEDEISEHDFDSLEANPKVHCDNPAEAILKASNTASVIATQFVCHDTQIEILEQKKRSKLQNFFDKTQSRKHGNDKKVKSGTSTPNDSDNPEEFENFHRKKKSKNLLSRLKRRELDNSSLLKPPTEKYGTKKLLGSEPSDASNLTALSMDTVEIIETEYPLFTEVPDSSNNSEVS